MHNGMSDSSSTLHQQHQQEQQQLVQEYISASRKRILIVNHEDDVNLTLKLALEEDEGEQVLDKGNSLQVDSLDDPILALKNFENGYYDLIIIAVVMPRMNSAVT
jgi:CheY-like chemotaxis protein